MENNFSKNLTPTLICDLTAINFDEKCHPLRLFGTLLQLGTLEYARTRAIADRQT